MNFSIEFERYDNLGNDAQQAFTDSDKNNRFSKQSAVGLTV
jgi:hypothetical protein